MTKKIKNDTKFANLFELKAIVNQSLKESFHLRYFALLFQFMLAITVNVNIWRLTRASKR